MRLTAAVRPKEPRNLWRTLLVAAIFLSLYALSRFFWPWSPKRGLGLGFGILAALAFLFEMFYSSRRPKAWPLGTAKAWIQTHVYLGLLAMLAVVLHAGGLPRGGFGWWLFVLSLWTTLSGLLGVFLQKTLPVALAEGLRVEALYERIPDLLDQLVVEADTLLAEASEVLERFYQQDLRPSFSTLQPSWSYVFDVRAGRERSLEPLRQISAYVGAEEKTKVEDLTSLYTEKIELDAQWSVQRVLRLWLWLHVPPAALLMALLVIHVFTWLWY
jgi:hypothetical protein